MIKDLFCGLGALVVIFSSVTIGLSIINLFICIFKYGMDVPDSAIRWLFGSIGIFAASLIISKVLMSEDSKK